MAQMSNSTICYIEKEDAYLMLLRNKKQKDVNKGKWIGVGGHCENGESPEDCIRREVEEETGLILDQLTFRGIITFVYGEDITEYIYLFTSHSFHGEQIPCNEGELHWIRKDQIFDLNLWDGDRIFLHLLEKNGNFFSLKIVYDQEDHIQQAVLNGVNMPLRALVDGNGNPTGARQTEYVIQLEELPSYCL